MTGSDSQPDLISRDCELIEFTAKSHLRCKKTFGINVIIRRGENLVTFIVST